MNFDWLKTAGSALSKIPFNPLMAGISGVANIAGSMLGANAENERYDKEMAFREKESKRDQKNIEQAQKARGIDLMNDNYMSALYRMLRR